MFISFEGLDGCGKTTQAQLLFDRLQKAGYEALAVREPGGTLLSEAVRGLLLNADLHIAPFAELLLFSASRNQLCTEVIRPALAAGKIVVADRFLDSSVAYQGYGRGVADPDWMVDFQLKATDGLLPDVTYWVQVSPELARERRGHRAEDRIERAGDAFFARVHEAYHQLAARFPERYVVIQGDWSVAAIHEAIWLDFQSKHKP